MDIKYGDVWELSAKHPCLVRGRVTEEELLELRAALEDLYQHILKHLRHGQA